MTALRQTLDVTVAWGNRSGVSQMRSGVQQVRARAVDYACASVRV
jgi:hypothetical protein